MQPIKSAKCSEQNTCCLLHSDEISSAKSRPELLQNEARCKITACNNIVLFISVQLLVVQLFLHKTGRRLAEIRSKNQLAQLVVDENENEERPRRKPPRPPEHSNQLTTNNCNRTPKLTVHTLPTRTRQDCVPQVKTVGDG